MRSTKLYPYGWVLWLGTCGAAPYPLSDHFDGQHFHNTDPQAKVQKNFADFLQWKLNSQHQAWPSAVEAMATPALPRVVTPDQAFITFIGHATLLIQLSGLNVLTDPVFSERVSPISFIGPKRVRPPGVALGSLPKIDLVVISHNHYDHLDLPSLRELHERFHPLFVVPLGNAKLLQEQGIERVVELDWWQSYEIDSEKSVTLTEAQHWSGRSLSDTRRALWGGYVIRDQGLQVFFAGDTGYNAHFTRIYQRFGPMNVSLLPIGAYLPRWFMQAQHMNPEDAVLAHGDLHSQLSIAMHFATFDLADEAINEPPRDLAASLDGHHIAHSEFIVPIPGQTIMYRAPPR